MSEAALNNMFSNMADEIFTKAGINKAGNEQWHDQCRDILSTKMAMLSATMGLSKKRVTIFEEQKQALVDDLIAMKEKGELAS